MRAWCALVGVSLLLALSSGVQAGPLDALLPPQDLTGEHDASGQSLLLEWEAPVDAVPVKYGIYQNGLLAGETTDKWFLAPLDEAVNVFTVTAWYDDGEESIPSEPLAAQPTSGGGNGGNGGGPFAGGGGSEGGSCEPINIIVVDQPPFVGTVIREECLPPVGVSCPIDLAPMRGFCKTE